MGDVVNAAGMFQGLTNRLRMWLSGIQFRGQRDLYELFGWKRLPDYRDYAAAYYRQGVAKRVIEAPVLGCWADPPQLTAQQEFNDAWDEVVETKALWHTIIRLDKLAGLAPYALLVVGFDDGRPLDSPISPTDTRQRKVLYMQPYHFAACAIKEYEADKTNERFGQPTMYNVNPGRFQVDGLTTAIGPNASELRTPFNVHWTRCVHIAEGMLEDGIFGASRLEVIFNDICDLLKVSGASSELFWMMVNRGMQVDVDKDMELSPEDGAELQKEVEDYQHQLRRFIRTRGVKINNLGSDPVSPKECFMVLIQLISMGTGIPQLVLLGAAEGQSSSRNDRANWADRLAERVAEYANPIVLKRLLDCLIWANVLPEPENLEIEWPEAFKMDPLERAQTSAQMARSAVNLIRGAVHAAPLDENGQPITSGPLFTNDEMRRMVSFGKHPPIFDGPTPTGDEPALGNNLDPGGTQPTTVGEASDPGSKQGKGSGTGKKAARMPSKRSRGGKPGPAKTPSKPLAVRG